MKTKSLLIFINLLFITSLIWAQLPSTDLYLFDLSKDATNNYHVHSPEFLNDFNKQGYNNQASFINDEEVFITSSKKNGSNTDIYLLNIGTYTLKRVTATKESEYSALLMPNYSNFSCIRVNDANEQHLWAYPLNREDAGKAIIKDLTNVGYHVWLSSNKLALFLVNEPIQLAMVELPDEKPRIIHDNIGRTLIKNEAGNLLYVHKYDDTYWYIKEYNPNTNKTEIVIQTLARSEDFTYTSDGTILMGNKNKLYSFKPGKDENWKEIMDLKVYGINRITRMAVNNRNKLIITNAAN